MHSGPTKSPTIRMNHATPKDINDYSKYSDLPSSEGQCFLQNKKQKQQKNLRRT